MAGAADDEVKPDENEAVMGTGEGEMGIFVVEEDDKTDGGAVEGTGDGEMGITGGGDEEGDKADEAVGSGDDGEMSILDSMNSTVVGPNGTKPCEGDVCILGEPPCYHRSALGVGLVRCVWVHWTSAGAQYGSCCLLGSPGGVNDGRRWDIEGERRIVACGNSELCARARRTTFAEMMPHCFPQSAGEAMCETHNYTATQCADPTLTQGCCEYEEGDDQGCWWNPQANAEIAADVRALNEAGTDSVVTSPPPNSSAVRSRAAAALGVALAAAAVLAL